MSPKSIIAIAVAAFIFTGIASAIGWGVGVYNTNIGLSNRYDAQAKVIETTMDKMRKTLVNQFKVNDQFAETFIKVAATKAEGRKGGSMFKMVTEAANCGPDFTPEMAIKMQNSISGELAEYKRAQDTFIDVWREQKTFCQKFPNLLIVGGREKPEPKIISSDVVKAAIETGKLSDDLSK